MKFHGSYQQDHREMRSQGTGKAYMFMMRTRQPAGAVTNQLYLAMDELADKVRAAAGGSRTLPRGPAAGPCGWPLARGCAVRCCVCTACCVGTGRQGLPAAARMAACSLVTGPSG